MGLLCLDKTMWMHVRGFMPCSKLEKCPNNPGGGVFVFLFLKKSIHGCFRAFFLFVHREIFKPSHLWFLEFPKSEITKCWCEHLHGFLLGPNTRRSGPRPRVVYKPPEMTHAVESACEVFFRGRFWMLSDFPRSSLSTKGSSLSMLWAGCAQGLAKGTHCFLSLSAKLKYIIPILTTGQSRYHHSHFPDEETEVWGAQFDSQTLDLATCLFHGWLALAWDISSGYCDSKACPVLGTVVPCRNPTRYPARKCPWSEPPLKLDPTDLTRHGGTRAHRTMTLRSTETPCSSPSAPLVPGSPEHGRRSLMLCSGLQPPARQLLKAWVLAVVQPLSHVGLFATPRTASLQASLAFAKSQSCSNSCPLSQWCHTTISSFVIPFSSCPQSFPASESFPISRPLEAGRMLILPLISSVIEWLTSSLWASLLTFIQWS